MTNLRRMPPTIEPLPWCLDPSSTVTIVRQGGRETRELGGLLEDGMRIAGGLAATGAGPGARIGLYASTSFGFIQGCLGVWASGNAVVSLPPPEGPEGRRRPGQRAAEIPVDLMVVDGTGEPPVHSRSALLDDLLGSRPFTGPAPKWNRRH